jgi:hypothetical protein
VFGFKTFKVFKPFKTLEPLELLERLERTFIRYRPISATGGSACG